MPAIDHPLIDRFLDALWLEKGLSDNTRQAYRSDLALFNGWLQEKNLELVNAGRELILDHLAWRLEQNYKPRSTARFLSGVRGFYRYLLREKLIALDPTLQVDMPQLGRPLPKSLSEADVEALLAAPDLSEAIGQRDRAMLEVLYACGLRVTELISLTLEQVNLRQGVLRVMGKGSKERLVPMGEEAIVWVERYMRDARSELLGGRPSDVNEQPGSASVVQSISSSLNGIGYSGIGYKTASVKTVALAKKGSTDFIEDSEENALNGKYPLSRFLYVYVNKAPNKPLAPLEAEFVKLVLSKQGQEVVVKDGYIPLPAKVAAKALADLGLKEGN